MKNGQRWTSTQWTNKETSGWLVWLHYYEWWVFEACWLHHYDQLAMSLPVCWSAENTKSTLEACWLHQHDRLVVSFHRPVVLFHRPVVLHCCRAMQCRESKIIFHGNFESSEISSEPVLQWEIPLLMIKNWVLMICGNKANDMTGRNGDVWFVSGGWSCWLLSG